MKIFLSIILFAFSLFAGIGISFGPGEIIIGNLEIGQTYTITNQFFAENKSKEPIDIQIIPIIPSIESLKKGYELLPNTNWIIPLQNYITNVEPNKKVQVGIKITIPENKKYAQKKYMFFLQARSVSKGFIGVAANSRVLLQIK